MKSLTELPPSVGIGLKPEHYARLLESTSASIHPSEQFMPGWVEVHPQNYFGAGGPPHRWLAAIAESLPISFHSVGLSLGSAWGHDREELDRLAALCDRYDPAQISDHLSWSGSANNRYPDLLPVPYTEEALCHFMEQVSIVQDRLRRSILIENPSRYLAFAGGEMDEADFLHQLCRTTGCGILFDINNIEVTATNLDLDPYVMIDVINPALVGEVHLAGHAREEHEHGPLLIDDHGSPVSELTWGLFARFIGRAGPRPVLIEWDTNIPEYEVLIAEAQKAEAIIAEQTAQPAGSPVDASLEETQAAMMRAFRDGPAHLPDGLLRGGRMRALLGMKVHANTISHARLVALEDTFPRTRNLLGIGKFNDLSRHYLDWPGATAHPLAQIGEDFAAFLGATGETRASADLAAFEWAWLESYHAAEAPALALADLAGVGEEALLQIALTRHPAACMLELDRLVHRIIGEEVPELANAVAMLLTRPGEQVLVSSATAAMAAIFARIDKPVSICNLLETCAEPEGKDRLLPDGAMAALIALMEAGALQGVE